VAPRGDYADLAQFDPTLYPPGWTRPDSPGAAKPQAETAAEDDLRLAPAIERIEQRPVIQLPPPDPPQRSSLYDGKYDDGLLGDGNVDPRQPEAWKKAPFLVGIVGFLIRPSTLSRMLPFVMGLALAIVLLHATIENASANTPTGSLIAIVLSISTAVVSGLWLLAFSAALLAIVEDTANGLDEVTGWPDLSPFEWLPGALYFPLAGVIAGLPGALLASALVSGGMPAIASPLVVLVSWLVLLPPVIYSMLAESSIFTVISVHTLRSFRLVAEAWLLFYLYSFLIALGLAVFDGLASLDWIAAQVAGAAGIVPLIFLYCRLLGRLMWYAAEKDAELAPSDPPAAQNS
jgi:hypothetical protein